MFFTISVAAVGSAARSTEIGAEAGKEPSVEETANIIYNGATSDNACAREHE
jgi:hypothetical protein